MKEIKRENSLAVTHPELAKEWHPTKNGDLTPDDITANYKEKVWWKCEFGHEWEAKVIYRKRGTRCPYCLSHGTSLPELTVFYYINKYIKNKVVHRYRELGVELDIYIPSLKIGIEYDGAYFHSNAKRDIKKDKWCKENDIQLYRIRENKLKPLNSTSIEFYCDGKESESFANAITQVIYEISGKSVSIKLEKDRPKLYSMVSTNIKENSIETTHPEIAKQWHPKKNGMLLPTHIVSGSNKKVWWQCEHGHEWQAVVNSRTSKNLGCPYCSGQRLIVGQNDLATTYPEIAKEWHPEKNGTLTPHDVTKRSGLKVWWQCKYGHEWKTTVASRTGDNRGCPYCTNQKPIIGQNDLATTHPELITEWNYAKNGDLKPTNVMSGSGKKVWWICEHGHEWEAFISNRTRHHSGCPYCSGLKAMVGFNDILTTHPQIAKQWNYAKNGNLKPTDVTASSGKKVWWVCEHGHEWEATVANRVSVHNCPYCSNRKVLQGFNDLATTHPELVAEWNDTKNGDLKPTDVTAGSGKKVWWVCEHGHEWETSVYNRTKYHSNCPHCTGQKVVANQNYLATTHPQIAKQWNYDKNGDLKPTDVITGSGKKVWWICEHGHEWEATIADRTREGRSAKCPYCSNRRVLQGFNDLATTHPQLTTEWNYAKNGDLKPTDVTAGSGKKVWWICEHGHEWEATIADRTREGKSTKCPHCFIPKAIVGQNDLATTHPQLTTEWNYAKNGDLKPTDVTAGSGKKVWWICEHGHEWEATIAGRAIQNYSCPYCSNKKVLQGFNDLATTHPKLVAEWNYTKNGDLKPTDVIAGSMKKVWWICEHGHEWEAAIKNRTKEKKNTKCPYCSGRKVIVGQNDLATTHPHLIKIWHPTLNGDLNPTDVKAGSEKLVWWINKNGTITQKRVCDKVKSKKSA